MKRFFIIGILSIATWTVYAQSEIQIPDKVIVNGKNYKTNNDIRAKEYVFPERIENSFIDTISNLLTVQLRGISKNGKYLNNSGNILLYDLSNNKVKWSKKINYGQSNIEQFNNVIIHTIANKSYRLSMDNGENEWEVKNKIYYADPFQNIGIGYKIKAMSGYTNTLEGIDLRTGNAIWKREINREYSWNDIFHLNDSVIVVGAAGLHAINLKNGTGWDYNTVTGKKDYTATVAANAAGVVLGVLTGTFVTSTGHSLVRDVVSNVLIDSSNIYIASKEQITRLDHYGKVQWTSPLPKDLTSKSSIFIKDSLLYIINGGYAFMGNRQLDFGTPFIAAFDIKSGRQMFLTPIEGGKQQINGFQIYNDTVLIVLKNNISKYSLINGSLIAVKTFDIDSLSELRYFVGSQVYIKSDSVFKSLETIDSTRHYLWTKSGKILELNDKLEVMNQIEYNQIYLYYLRTKDYRFITRQNETIVLDKANKIVADLKASSDAKLLGSKLYDMQEKSFIEIDLDEFIKK